MENFQYSVQLSDQDWAEFSATAEECGLLQAGLASGDELLSSDTDQRDNSPPGPPPLLEGQLAPGGSGRPGFEEEGKAATGQLVSRSWREPVLAPGPSQQTPSTSAQPSLSSGAALSVPSLAFPGPASPRDEMQGLLPGWAPQAPAPRPPGEPPRSTEPPSRSAAPQRPPGSPGAPPRSPGRKKRRAAGAKGGGRLGAPGSAPIQLGSAVLAEPRPEEGLGLAGSRGRGLPAGGAGLELGPESAGASEQVTRPGPGAALSTSVPTTERGARLLRMIPRAEPVSVLDPEAPRDVSMAKSDVPQSTPASKLQPEMSQATPAFHPPPEVPQSTPASKLQPEMSQATPAFHPPPEVPQSTPASKLQPETSQSTPAFHPPPEPEMSQSTPASKPPPESTPASKLQPETSQSTPAFHPPPESTPASKPPPEVPQSTPASKPRLDVDLLVLGPAVKPQVESSTPASKAALRGAPPHLAPETRADGAVSTPAVPQDWPDQVEAEVAPLAELGLSPVPPPGVRREKPGGEPSAGAPAQYTGEPPLGPGPVQAPKKKRVRFSVTEPGPEEPVSGAAPGLPPTATAPRMAAEGRRGSGAWDAVAVGSRAPQPRILKHLPPPAPSASGGPGPKGGFAVTLPEAYEFFLCDTIEEEDEDAEEAAEDSQAPAEVQWPDVCEFFFQDGPAQRAARQKGGLPAPPPQARPAPAAPPGDPVPISIPEAYEHFLGEDQSGGLLEQATGRPGSVLWGVGTGTPAAPSPATAEQLSRAVRQAGVCVVGAPWPARDSGTHCPGSAAKTAVGEEGSRDDRGRKAQLPAARAQARRASPGQAGLWLQTDRQPVFRPNGSGFCPAQLGRCGAAPAQALPPPVQAPGALHLTFPPEGVYGQGRGALDVLLRSARLNQATR
uniref:PGC-1 and ERR-induced regulator in muscle protein 1 n=1 Tax=Catagonus wagneri TaxID=51154 RepID=A0A8C3VJ83_9CETA